MEEMLDSSSVLGDSLELRRRLASDGYLLIRGLIDPEVVSRPATHAREVLYSQGCVGSPTPEGLPLALPAEKPPSDVFGLFQRIESLHSLAWNRRMFSLACSILGPTAYAQPRKALETIFPEGFGDHPIAAHRDNLGGAWCRDVLTFWVPLSYINRGSGGLAVLRGSQTYKHILPDRTFPVRPPLSRVPDDSSELWLTSDLGPGDVVLFHCYTIHKVLLNRTSRIQMAAEYRWQTIDHPIHVSATQPYGYFFRYPAIPDWVESTSGWDSPSWCSYPDGVDVLTSRGSTAGQEVPSSRLVTVSPYAREEWSAKFAGIEKSLPWRLPDTYDAGRPPISN